MHPQLHGGVAGHDCTEAAWNVQADIEAALLVARRLVFAAYDHLKYLDSFGLDFTFRFLVS